MGDFLFEKIVDQSVLKDGFTIPVNEAEKLQEALGAFLNKGDSAKIKIIIDGKDYEANFNNIKFSGNNTRYQIRYSYGSDICKYLKMKFIHTSNLVEAYRTDNRKITIDEKNQEKMEIFSADDNAIEIKCYPKYDNVVGEFVRYIGPENSFSGYQCSYKLVFLKVYFERFLDGKDQKIGDFSQQFLQFYIDRFKSGKKTDVGVTDIIANPNNTTVSQTIDLIKNTPYKYIHDSGYFNIEKTEQSDSFCMSEELKTHMTKPYAKSILNLINRKIANYYRIKVDSVEGKLYADFNKLINEYLNATNQAFTSNPFGKFVREDVTEDLYNVGIVEKSKYKITGSVGQGNWATIPWIGVFDKRVTSSATKGVYIVYLLSKDSKSLYLTFNQGCTEIRKTHTKKETIDIMRQKASQIVKEIDSRGFRTDEDINLGSGISELGELYQKGTIFYKEYRKDMVPNEDILEGDLKKMVDIYKEYVEKNIMKDIDKLPIEDKETSETMLDNKKILEHVKKYISSKGFIFEEGLIENYYLSLKSKPFVILAGTSGTGKTRLVRLFAEAIGATTENGRYTLVPVRPDWSDSSDLFGHVDLNGKFIPGAVIDFIKKAEGDSDKPYFLCLDEMNLARVEYYLSDILSVIETREMVDDKVVTDPLISENFYGSDADAKEKYGLIRIPDNLYIIGTVNMDETTFPFSRKVLDRANTIEFSTVDFGFDFSEAEEIDSLEIDNSFLKTEYLFLKQCVDSDDHLDLANKVCVELQHFNEELEKANAHVGYRVRDEIVFYLLNNLDSNLISYNEALDNEIMQKILPRIQGSSFSVKNMLCELFKKCAGDYEGYQTENENVSSKMFGWIKNKDCKYRLSAQKIAYMVRRFEEDGFTAYWL